MDLNCNIFKCQFGEYIFPQRYVTCIMTLLGVVVSVNLRSTINIALIKMVIPKETTKNVAGHQCPAVKKNEMDENLTGGTLLWTDAQQSLILAAFFPAYVLTQIFGGILADRFGAKHLFSMCIFVSAILSLFTPLAVAIGDWQLLVVLRVLMGLCLGATFPAIFTILAKWAPPKEQGILGAIITSGVQLGSITSSLGTTALISKSNSWKLPFYVWGILSIIWYQIYFIFSFSEPSQSPFISEKEAAMLEQELDRGRNNTNFKIPWRKILSSKPVWAMIVCMVGHNILFLFVSTYIPKYMVDVLKQDIRKNGTTGAMPYLAMFISAIISGCLSDLFVRKDIMSVTACRKLFCAIGGMLPALFLVLASHMGCASKNVTAMFILCLGSMFPSVLINPTDLSKNFAGVIMSIANCLGALLYFPWPNIAAAITVNHTVEQWRIVMWMVAILEVICTSCFLRWGSSDRQDFDTIA